MAFSVLGNWGPESLPSDEIGVCVCKNGLRERQGRDWVWGKWEGALEDVVKSLDFILKTVDKRVW